MTERNTSGLGIAGVLGIIFVTLKLCHVINWSWWWVTAPFWAGLPIVVVVVIVHLIYLSVADRRGRK